MRRITFYTCLLFISMALFPQVSFAEKRDLTFTMNGVDPTTDPSDKPHRTVMAMPKVAIDENELFFSKSHPLYTIKLKDENGGVVFEQSISEGIQQLEIPLELKGDYKLVLIQGERMFFSYITL